MDNLNLIQLIMSDGVFSLEVLALFAIGFYLIISIAAFPVSIRNLSPRHLSGDKRAHLRGLVSKTKPSQLQIGFRFATIVGVGAVLSPARTWLRQETKSR